MVWRTGERCGGSATCVGVETELSTTIEPSAEYRTACANNSFCVGLGEKALQSLRSIADVEKVDGEIRPVPGTPTIKLSKQALADFFGEVRASAYDL